ncbi:uncharacterized protein LOC135682402 [Rhopilema esculentum]|uniref:uncharacterized protein LOC135682402 n=1 Tax=Rhopilema esculentum TaxID=499914 RepID=UPI0031CE87EE|eukprot:gene14367-5414_t
MTKRVFLWTAPRSVSTAFERSFRELKNSKIFHEPYCCAYYFGPQRQSSRYENEAPDEVHNYKAIGENLLKEYDGIDLVFVKDMAYGVENHFNELLGDGMSSFQHTFLIRDPKKAVPSLHAASVNKQLTGWDYFDPKESGFRQMYELYMFVVKHIDKCPVIVDADDLLNDPEGIMQEYCERIGARFEKEMLEWEPNPMPDWERCVRWHENVLKSSGFQKKNPNNFKIDASRKGEEKLPNVIIQTIKNCMPFYEGLHKKRIQVSTAKGHKSSFGNIDV